MPRDKDLDLKVCHKLKQLRKGFYPDPKDCLIKATIANQLNVSVLEYDCMEEHMPLSFTHFVAICSLYNIKYEDAVGFFYDHIHIDTLQHMYVNKRIDAKKAEEKKQEAIVQQKKYKVWNDERSFLTVNFIKGTTTFTFDCCNVFGLKYQDAGGFTLILLDGKHISFEFKDEVSKDRQKELYDVMNQQWKYYRNDMYGPFGKGPRMW